MNPSIQKDLFTLEKQERAMNLKFGVIYAKESQMTDDEFLSNTEGSKHFHNFLDLLGEKIKLKVSSYISNFELIYLESKIGNCIRMIERL